MQKYLRDRGTKYMKYVAINEEVKQQFEESLQSGIPVHDREIMEWGLIAAEKCGIPDFKVIDKLVFFEIRNSK
jgi:hypothetical protein